MASAQSSGIPFITGQTLGALISGGTGSYWQGFKFTVGSQPITITELGHYVLPGNKNTHTMKIVDAASGADLAGGSVDVSLTGGVPGQFKYAALAKPLTLSANRAYYLLSWEVEGQDFYHDKDTVVRPTGAATIQSGALRTPNGTLYLMGSTNNSWGPLNFKYIALSGDATAEQPPAGSAAPVISSFTTSSPAITAGQSVTLAWSVANGTALSIDQNVGTVTGASKTVSPTNTTTYTLTASNSSGSSTQKVTVNVSAPVAAAASGTASNAEEFVGPFPSWANVKSQYGAKGDGVSDDTAALQRGLNDIGARGKPSVLYIPAGTYRVSSTLYVAAKSRVAVIGENPATTKIKWAGPSGGTMHWVNGLTQSSWGRITWDGSGTAAIGVGQQWDGHTGYAPTSTKHFDEVFQDMGRGFVAGGSGGANDAEGSILRCKFYRMSQAGVSTETGNALDWFVWDSEFVDSARGVTNWFGAGNFSVYRSVFRNSSIADIQIGNTQYFGIRGNTSVGSQMFVDSPNGSGNADQLILQDNVVLNPKQAKVIRYGNMGPLIMIDNQIASPAGAAGPVVDGGVGFIPSVELVAIGNKFTVSNPFTLAAKMVRKQEVDTSTVSASNISASITALPATPPNVSRQIFEVPAGANAAAIQNAINQAAAYAGQRPVVHLPAENYPINSEIVIPANLDVQIIGDSRSSRLFWTGPAGGTVFRLQGPSKAIFQDIWIEAGSIATGFTIQNADQPGSRIFGDLVAVSSAKQHNIFADQLNNTRIDFQHLDHGSSNLSSILANGGSQGASGTSRIAIFGGMSEAYKEWVTPNSLMYDVTNGGKILATDIWYEGNTASLVNLTNSGMFTLSGANIAPYTSASGTYAIQVNNFNGTATFMGLNMWFKRKFLVTGANGGMKVLGIGMSSDYGNNWIDNSAAGGQVGFLHNLYFSNGNWPVSDSGASDPSFLRDAVQLLRTQKPTPLGDLGPGVTDVRFFNVLVDLTVNGIYVSAR